MLVIPQVSIIVRMTGSVRLSLRAREVRRAISFIDVVLLLRVRGGVPQKGTRLGSRIR